MDLFDLTISSPNTPYFDAFLGYVRLDLVRLQVRNYYPIRKDPPFSFPPLGQEIINTMDIRGDVVKSTRFKKTKSILFIESVATL